ncbi:TPA: hypothetical protein EYP83_00100, partial [Candidatus Geothermarchaeota archaeon]|nr:hypothetical protein [Candidatus Geothermarchaeota archaeon]
MAVIDDNRLHVVKDRGRIDEIHEKYDFLTLKGNIGIAHTRWATHGAPDKALAFAEIALAAYTAHNLPPDMEAGLEESAFYDPANFTFPCSAHVVQVEVDPDTGAVTLQRYVAVEDVG